MTPDLRVGTVLADRYRLDSLLGEGGMGKVYAAEHVLMKKRLAVKILHRELTTVPEVVARFEREAMAAAHIEHPNVAAATDFGKLPDGSVFLVLEFVQGRGLRDEIAEGPFELSRALRITRQMLLGLVAAHELKIVHRDLKPENVMLVEKAGDRDFVKVLDFGIAKVPIGEGGTSNPPTTITKAGMVFGTPEYMAPEQALGQPVDGRADLYALGVMLYEMIAGVRPFSSKSAVGILGQQLANDPPPFRERAPGILVPHQVEVFVMHLLKKEASDRFLSAKEALSAFDEITATKEGGRQLFTMTSGSPNSVLGSAPRGSPAESSAAYSAIRASISGAEDTGNYGIPKRRKWLPSSMAEFEAGAARFASNVADKLPPAFRQQLARLPLPAVVALLTLGTLTTLIVLVLMLKLVFSGDETEPVASASGSASNGASASISATGPSTAPGVPQPTAAELDAASKQGVAALEALREKYPKAPIVLIALGRLQMKEKPSLATDLVSRALELDPSLTEDGKVASVLFYSAQMVPSTDAAFMLLRGPMGARGADIMYDLTTYKGVRAEVKQKALTFIKSPAFEKVARPPLAVAVKLMFAKGCTARRELLPAATKDGDARALPYLQPMQQRTGCGRRKRDDCYPCLRGDTQLDEAIKAISARTPKP